MHHDIAGGTTVHLVLAVTAINAPGAACPEPAVIGLVGSGVVLFWLVAL